MDETDGTVRVGVTYRTIRTVCERQGCERVIEQPDRAGRKRRYCSAACRQAAHRMRQKQPSDETRAWLKALGV